MASEWVVVLRWSPGVLLNGASTVGFSVLEHFNTCDVCHEKFFFPRGIDKNLANIFETVENVIFRSIVRELLFPVKVSEERLKLDGRT